MTEMGMLSYQTDSTHHMPLGHFGNTRSTQEHGKEILKEKKFS